jgi:hypothetical protein
MNPDRVFAMIYDAILRACHDHHGHTHMAQSLRHSRRVEGFRDAASENSGCEVALQVLGFCR